MKTMTALAAAAALLAACENPSEPRGASLPRPSFDTESGGRPTLAFVQSYWTCTLTGGAGAVNADYCTEPFYSSGTWTLHSSVVAAYDDGSSPVVVADDANAPTWSPDGTRIAFERAAEIFAGVAGGTPANLTNHTAIDAAPAWSPGGQTIAFSSNRSGQAELYLMNAADGSNVVRITNGVGFTGNPTWSPDGSRIAFDCEVESGNSDICAVNADGTGFVRLTSDPAPDIHPAWSPTGAQIAFSTGEFWYEQLAVMNADGSGVSRVGGGIRGYHPAWSPDGTRIAFARYYADDYVCQATDCLYIVRTDGTGEVFLGNGGSPAWRPGDLPLPPPPPDQPPVVQFSSNCVSLTCKLYDSSTDDHGIVSRVWAFGDGSSVAAVNPSHTYAAAGTYQVTLAVTDSVGQTSSITQSVTVVDVPPVARLAAPSCVELTCTFDGSGSTADKGVTSYQWAFGDGWGGSTINYFSATPRHGYAAAGTYTVTLTVADGGGQTATATQTVTVTGLPAGAPPVASFTYRCSGLTCTVDGRGSTDDWAIVSYSWDLGKTPDGSASGAVVTTAYPSEGPRTVVLTVTDGAGQKSSIAQTINVVAIPGDAPPVARLKVTCTGLSCWFDASASWDDHGIMLIGWNLGCCVTSEGTPSGPLGMTYPAAGTYTVTLTVTDYSGQINTAKTSLTVSPTTNQTVTAPALPDQPPVARFTYSCAGTVCTLDGRSSTDDRGIVSYAWDLGQSGSTATGALVTYDYRRGGSYRVTLTVKDAAGQSSSATQSVAVPKAAKGP